MLLFAAVVALGTLGGAVARRLHLPEITGQILIGVLLGGAAFHIIPETARVDFSPIASVALSFIAVTIGGHLEFRRLHNAVRRVALISAAQFSVVFFLTFAVFQLFNPLGLESVHRLPAHLIIASIATSTSPISTIHLIREKQARGLLVKTAIATLAVNNFLTICAYEMLHSLANTLLSPHHHWMAVIKVLGSEGLAMALGSGTGWLLVAYTHYLTRRHGELKNPGRHEQAMLNGKLFTGLLITICFNAGLCEFLTLHWGQANMRPSPILANMMTGLVLANRSSFKEDLLGLFQIMEHGIFAAFFVLAGTHLNLETVNAVWVGALVLFLVRMVGMFLGGIGGGLFGRSTRRIARHIGGVLSVQGAIAIALIILLETDPLYHELTGAIASAVVLACLASELIGPVIVGKVLDHAGETRRDRARLIEFLQEEFIDPHLRAQDKWEAIDSLCHFMCRTHNIEESPHELMDAIRERERSMPTGIGAGVAVPHARIKEGNDIVGVLGRLEHPVDFGAPDGIPARLVVMVATPENQAHKHLEVIAALSRMMSNDAIREAILHAQTADEIHEIIDSEEADTFNYFVET